MDILKAPHLAGTRTDRLPPLLVFDSTVFGYPRDARHGIHRRRRIEHIGVGAGRAAPGWRSRTGTMLRIVHHDVLHDGLVSGEPVVCDFAQFEPLVPTGHFQLLFPVHRQAVYEAYRLAVDRYIAAGRPRPVPLDRDEGWEDNAQPGWDQGGRK